MGVLYLSFFSGFDVCFSDCFLLKFSRISIIICIASRTEYLVWMYLLRHLSLVLLLVLRQLDCFLDLFLKSCLWCCRSFLFFREIPTPPLASEMSAPASCVLIGRFIECVGEVHLSTLYVSGVMHVVILVMAETVASMTLQDARFGTLRLHSNFHIPL